MQRKDSTVAVVWKIQIAKKGSRGSKDLSLLWPQDCNDSGYDAMHARTKSRKKYSASPYLFNVDYAPLYNPFHLFSELSSTAAVCIPSSISPPSRLQNIRRRRKKWRKNPFLFVWPFAAIRVSLSIGWKTPSTSSLPGFFFVCVVVCQHDTIQCSTATVQYVRVIAWQETCVTRSLLAVYWLSSTSCSSWIHFRSVGVGDNNNKKKRGDFILTIFNVYFLGTAPNRLNITSSI